MIHAIRGTASAASATPADSATRDLDWPFRPSIPSIDDRATVRRLSGAGQCGPSFAWGLAAARRNDQAAAVDLVASR